MPSMLGPIPMPEPPAAYVKVIVARSWEDAHRVAADLGFPRRRHVPPSGVRFITDPVDLRSIQAAEFRPCEVYFSSRWTYGRGVAEIDLIRKAVHSRIRLGGRRGDHPM